LQFLLGKRHFFPHVDRRRERRIDAFAALQSRRSELGNRKRRRVDFRKHRA
jgi:hypothetical protein